MKVPSEKGFTLVELMVVLAILGALSVTGLHAFDKLRGRAVGSEALVIMKQLLDGEVMYYLENEKYFPEPGEVIAVFKDDPSSKPEIRQIKDALKVYVPVKHHLDFVITHDPLGRVLIQIDADFPIFTDGSTGIRAVMDKSGKVEYL